MYYAVKWAQKTTAAYLTHGCALYAYFAQCANQLYFQQVRAVHITICRCTFNMQNPTPWNYFHQANVQERTKNYIFIFVGRSSVSLTQCVTHTGYVFQGTFKTNICLQRCVNANRFLKYGQPKSDNQSWTFKVMYFRSLKCFKKINYINII